MNLQDIDSLTAFYAKACGIAKTPHKVVMTPVSDPPEESGVYLVTFGSEGEACNAWYDIKQGWVSPFKPITYWMKIIKLPEV
jgi:hypothetical protein